MQATLTVLALALIFSLLGCSKEKKGLETATALYVEENLSGKLQKLNMSYKGDSIANALLGRHDYYQHTAKGKKQPLNNYLAVVEIDWHKVLQYVFSSEIFCRQLDKNQNCSQFLRENTGYTDVTKFATQMIELFSASKTKVKLHYYLVDLGNNELYANLKSARQF